MIFVVVSCVLCHFCVVFFIHVSMWGFVLGGCGGFCYYVANKDKHRNNDKRNTNDDRCKERERTTDTNNTTQRNIHRTQTQPPKTPPIKLLRFVWGGFFGVSCGVVSLPLFHLCCLCHCL